VAPASTLTLNGSAQITGQVVCDRLIVNGASVIVDPAPLP
jgi:cytoskeletal protein CcmA (bactofilin family)